MKQLDKAYLDQLEIVKQEIQSSPELEKYLADEEEEDYQALQEKFEKKITEIYELVAAENPLQLFELEKVLLDPEYEGLFLPRLLGYAVLRGEINEEIKYVRPQERFKEILLAIVDSYYFDIIKQRTGQAIQIGFALSSDIWITNLIEEIENKKVGQFLMTQKLQRYRDITHRRSGYERFQRQFKTTNFQTTLFPSNPTEMNILFGGLRKFLEYRIETKADHSSYTEELLKVLENDELRGSDQYLHLLGLVANFIDLSDGDRSRLVNALNKLRSSDPTFSERYFLFLNRLLKSKLVVEPSCDQRMANLLDHSVTDDLTNYYDTMKEVSSKGFVHADALEAVRKLYGRYDGLSTVNDCLRHSILSQLIAVLKNLTEAEYADYFELNKTFVAYMDIFEFQQFNQVLKEHSITYVRKLLKKYTDKRGKDYQDIKKFVIPTFQDLGFMREKEVLELFKTRRKKKAATT